MEVKVKAAHTLASLVGRIPDPIKKEEYLRLIAGRVGIQPETLLKASQKSEFSDRIDLEVKQSEKRLRHDEQQCLWLIRLLVERPEIREKIKENLDLMTIENEALRELLSNSFQMGEGNFAEGALLDAVQSEDAQRLLARLSFEEAGPELLYPVEWWLTIIKNRQNEKRLSKLSAEIAEAERTGDYDRFAKLVLEKLAARRELETTRQELAQISVFLEGRESDSDLASLVAEIGPRELARAESAGDHAAAKAWKELLKSREKKGGHTGRKSWEVPF